MWANAQRDGRPAKYRWCPVPNTAKFGSRPLLDCLPCSNAANRTAQDLEDASRKVNFAPRKIPLRSYSGRKCIYSLPAQVSAKHCERFGWLLLSDVAAKTRKLLNLAGVPQTNETI